MVQWLNVMTALVVGLLLMVFRRRFAQHVVAQQNWLFKFGLGERHVARFAWIALSAGAGLVVLAGLHTLRLVKAMR